MSEINSRDDAWNRLKAFFPDIPSPYRNNYRNMACFLSDKKDVSQILEKVSREVWIEYNKQQYAKYSNRFTGALIRYASNFGFQCQDNVVFTGPLDDATFLQHVKNGVLWKDTFAPAHGEFSHTLQWLATAFKGLGRETASYYKKSAEIESRNELRVRDIRKRVPLWAWLVDCFPSKSATDDGKEDNIHSNSCRVPNEITKLAREKRPKTVDDKDAWFIGLYVNSRQTVTLANAKDKGMADDVYEERKNESRRTDIGAIKSYQTQHYEELLKVQGQKQWLTQANPESVRTMSGNQKTVHRVFTRRGFNQNTQKDMVEMEFHGIKGLVPKTIAGSINK